MNGSTLALLLGKPKGRAGQDEKKEDAKEGEVDTLDEGMKATAREIIDAVKADDEEELATVLKSFLEQC